MKEETQGRLAEKETSQTGINEPKVAPPLMV